mmetsp:Transcript_5275/g.7825  ORF Transcript_5275/g.7825 Transcript_5275/m.7825 type:complete len:208 (-) Transcript_5275:495-1118(-)
MEATMTMMTMTPTATTRMTKITMKTTIQSLDIVSTVTSHHHPPHDISTLLHQIQIQQQQHQLQQHQLHFNTILILIQMHCVHRAHHHHHPPLPHPNQPPLESKSPAMTVIHSSAQRVTGVMNIRPITRYVSVIGVMRFIVRVVMRWISVRIVGRLFVVGVVRCVVVSFVGVGCVRIVLLLVEGAASSSVRGTPNLLSSAILAKCPTV